MLFIDSSFLVSQFSKPVKSSRLPHPSNMLSIFVTLLTFQSFKGSSEVIFIKPAYPARSKLSRLSSSAITAENMLLMFVTLLTSQSFKPSISFKLVHPSNMPSIFVTLPVFHPLKLLISLKPAHPSNMLLMFVTLLTFQLLKKLKSVNGESLNR